MTTLDDFCAALEPEVWRCPATSPADATACFKVIGHDQLGSTPIQRRHTAVNSTSRNVTHWDDDFTRRREASS